MPGKKWRSIKNPRAYEALRREGYSKEKAARISNAGVTRQHKRGRSKRGKWK